jgi:hypothetical protein
MSRPTTTPIRPVSAANAQPAAGWRRIHAMTDPAGAADDRG